MKARTKRDKDDGEAKELQNYINEQLLTARSASLVWAIGKYDFYNHLIPTVAELNRALAGLAMVLVRTEEDISLIPSKKKLGLRTLSDDDMSFLYKAYLRALKKRGRRRDSFHSRGPTSS
jgi:hypothetical protein